MVRFERTYSPIDFWPERYLLHKNVKIRTFKKNIYVGQILKIADGIVYLYDGKSPIQIFPYDNKTGVRLEESE